jgi:hypothetical protein
MFVNADRLTRQPERVMKEIWEYLEEEPYKHDFDNVEQYTNEVDVGFPYGDHIIKKKVEPTDKGFDRILGKELSDLLGSQFQWINDL